VKTFLLQSSADFGLKLKNEKHLNRIDSLVILAVNELCTTWRVTIQNARQYAQLTLVENTYK